MTIQVHTSEIIIDRPQADGRRKLRYQLEIEDARGEVEAFIINRGLVPSEFDAASDLAAWESTQLDSLAEMEIDAVIDAMIRGENPLRDELDVPVLPRWNAYQTVVLAALRYFLSEEDPLIALRSVPFSDHLSNVQIRGLLGVTAQEATEIRSFIDGWKPTHAKMSSHVPWLERDA